MAYYVPVDDLTLKLIEMLAGSEAMKPREIEYDNDPKPYEVAIATKWEQENSAYRFIIGVHLVRDALTKLEEHDDLRAKLDKANETIRTLRESRQEIAEHLGKLQDGQNAVFVEQWDSNMSSLRNFISELRTKGSLDSHGFRVLSEAFKDI